MSEPVVRLSRPTDINTLRDLDIKCYDYPLSMPEWQAYVNGVEGEPDDKKVRCVVAEVYRKAAGFGVWRKSDDDTVEIIRLGVRDSYRLNGIARSILADIEQGARRACCDKMQITVPDMHCQPEGQRDADDVSVFLAKVGFKPTGKVITDWKFMFGRRVDGYIFEKAVL